MKRKIELSTKKQALASPLALAALGLLALPRASWAYAGLIDSGYLMPAAVVIFIVSLPIFSCLLGSARRRSQKEYSWIEAFLYSLGTTVFVSFLMIGLDESRGGPLSVEVSYIVSELRNMKAVTMMYFSDHLESANNSLPAMRNHVELLKPYMDNPERTNSERYAFYTDGFRFWWVGHTTDAIGSEARKSLVGRAEFVGLYGSPRLDTPPESPGKKHLYKKDDGAVWMPVPVPPARGPGNF